MTLDSSVATIVIAVISLASGWLVSRTGKVGDREHKLIDQLQEELTNSKEERSKLSGRVDELSRAFNSFLAREAMYEYHVAQQDQKIRDLGGAPLPRPHLIEKMHEGE